MKQPLPGQTGKSRSRKGLGQEARELRCTLDQLGGFVGPILTEDKSSLDGIEHGQGLSSSCYHQLIVDRNDVPIVKCMKGGHVQPVSLLGEEVLRPLQGFDEIGTTAEISPEIVLAVYSDGGGKSREVLTQPLYKVDRVTACPP